MSKAKQVKDDVALWQKQIGELTEALQRERADAVNLRRRYEEQIASLQTLAKASVVRDLLPVIDNFERALKHVPKAQNQESRIKNQEEKQLQDWVDGVAKIVVQFEKTLEQLGVQKIKTVGQPFNPHLHEAISMEEGDGQQEVVCEELQSGYTLGKEVLRHAMVRVRTEQ